MKLDLPDIVTGKVIPSAVETELLKKDTEQRNRKRSIQRSWLQCFISVILGAILSNLDRIIPFVAKTISGLLNYLKTCLW